MNIYTGLLFQQGYIQDPALAVSLAEGEGTKVEEPEAQDAGRAPERRGARASFHSHAVSMICGTTALSPFR